MTNRIVQAGRTRHRGLAAAIGGFVVSVALGGCSGTTISGTGRLDSGGLPPTGAGSAVTSAAPGSAASDTAAPGPGATVSFRGVTVSNARDLGVAPGVASRAEGPVTQLLFEDLVTGTGQPPRPARR